MDCTSVESSKNRMKRQYTPKSIVVNALLKSAYWLSMSSKNVIHWSDDEPIGVVKFSGGMSGQFKGNGNKFKSISFQKKFRIIKIMIINANKITIIIFYKLNITIIKKIQKKHTYFSL